MATRDQAQGERLQEFVRALLGEDVGFPSSGRLLLVDLFQGRTGHPRVEDAVQEFCLRLLIEPKRAEELLAMEPAAALAAVKHRAKQFLVEQDPEWPTRKLLREHVREALARELPVVSELPADLLQGDRIQQQLVRQAVAFFEANEPETVTNVNEKVRRYAERLREKYCAQLFPDCDSASGSSPPEPASHGTEAPPQEQLARLVDARAVLERLARWFDPTELRILQMRLNGMTLAEISKNVGKPIATVSDAVRNIEETIAARHVELGTSRTMELAFGHFKRAYPGAGDPGRILAAGLRAAEQDVYRRSRGRSPRKTKE